MESHTGFQLHLCHSSDIRLQVFPTAVPLDFTTSNPIFPATQFKQPSHITLAVA